MDSVVEVNNSDLIAKLETKTIEELVKEIKSFKEQSALSFYEIGTRLKLIREKKLYKEKGFDTFIDFLKTPEIDFSSVIAERFIQVTEDESLQKSLYLGSAKVTEILKLNPEHRKRLLSAPVEIKGIKKKVDELSLNEIKKISQDFKREGKLKCDRCGRWVDHLKELDGKFYGVGSKHSCYEQEVEERRLLQENAIPAEQFDNVLDSLKKYTPKKTDENENIEPKKEDISLNWLPESIYQVYGQFLNEYDKNTKEISKDSLEKEEEVLGKLIHLLKNRLRDVKETLDLLEENAS
ncbi:MAG: hypothetical protein U0457_18570 [Candidatus Sericytochromatia bacterium]